MGRRCGTRTIGGGSCAHPVAPGSTACAAGHPVGPAALPFDPDRDQGVVNADPFTDPAAAAWQKAGFDGQAHRDWPAAGFATPAEARPWADLDWWPTAAREWRSAGIAPYPASEYFVHGFSPEQATTWLTPPDGIASGPMTAQMAHRWNAAGWTPLEAHAWTAAGIAGPDGAAGAESRARTADFRDVWPAEQVAYPHRVQAGTWAHHGFGPDEALRWRTAGFDFRHGRGPVTARVWEQHGFSAEDAGDWHRRIGGNPGTAAQLRRFGVTPEAYVPGDERFADESVWERRDQWRSVGVDDGMRAREWASVGFAPETAGPWLAAGARFGGETIDWVAVGMGPSDLAAWRRAFGPVRCTARQAAEFRSNGWTPESLEAVTSRLDERSTRNLVDSAPTPERVAGH